MTPDPTPNLDRLLRDGARQRRALLEQQPFPVGDYPARPRRAAAAPTAGPRLLTRALGFALPAAVLVVAGLIAWWQPASPPASPPTAVEQPTLAPASSLLARLRHTERLVRHRAEPFWEHATAAPQQVPQWPRLLDAAEQRMQEPMQQQLDGLQANLRHATQYLRDQWQIQPSNDSSPTGSSRHDHRDPPSA